MAENLENRRGKISAPPCKEFVENVITPVIKGELETPYHAYQVYLDINKAHVLMLAKQGVITEDVCKAILKVTDQMAKMGEMPTFEIDPSREDFYFNLEHYLIEKVGLDIGGQQHTARSRNDLYATSARMEARYAFFDICKEFNKMRSTILKIARENEDAVFAGYTHLQPSEPITFAHYCSAILGALQRDYRRLAEAYDDLNKNPLGGTSMGSTTFNIDRRMTARLLGFKGIVDNSIDCVASRDYVTEILAAYSMAAITISRFCTDLYIWNAPDYGYVEVDDSCATCSSIMPQKKNPVTLEIAKAKAGHLEGFYVGALSVMKNIPYTLTCDLCYEAASYFNRATAEMKGSCQLVEASVRGLTIHKEHMLERAKSNFCTVTELANALVRHDKISFREAHEIVALVVDYMLKNNKKSNEIGTKEVNLVFEKLFGKKTCMTDHDVQVALDPVLSVNARTVEGGSAPSEVSRQLDNIAKQLEADIAQVNAREADIAAAKAELEAEVAKAIA